MGDTAAGRIGKRLEPPSDEDWRRHIALIARYLPGFGNPLDMTLPELEGWAAALACILERENGPSAEGDDHRARVEAEMRRLHG